MKDLNRHEIGTIREQIKALGNPLAIRRYLQRTLQVDHFLAKRRVEKVGSLPLHLEIHPHAQDSPVVIFLPGIGTYAEMYSEFFYHLNQQGFTVVGLDLRGHGYSGGERGCYTVSQVVADIEQVIQHLQKQFSGPVLVFGNSIGAPLAVAAAERHRAIRGVICHTLFLTEFPPDIFHLWGWQWLAIWSLYWPKYRIDFRQFIDVETLLKHNPFRHFVEYDDLLVWNYPLSTLASVYTHRSQVMWQDCDFPALIVIGEQDEILSPGYQYCLRRVARHPFELQVVPGRHMLPLDAPEQLAITAATWYQRVLSENS